MHYRYYDISFRIREFQSALLLESPGAQIDTNKYLEGIFSVLEDLNDSLRED